MRCKAICLELRPSCAVQTEKGNVWVEDIKYIVYGSGAVGRKIKQKVGMQYLRRSTKIQIQKNKNIDAGFRIQ